MLIEHLIASETFPHIKLDDMVLINKDFLCYRRRKQFEQIPSNEYYWPFEIPDLYILYQVMQRYLEEMKPNQSISILTLLNEIETKQPELSIHLSPLWMEIYDHMLKHELNPMNLSNFFGTEVSSPSQFAAWIMFLAKIHPAHLIIASGLIQRYFERNCGLDFPQISKAFKVIAACAQSMLDGELRQRLLQIICELDIRRTSVRGFENYSLKGEKVQFVVYVVSDALQAEQHLNIIAKSAENLSYYLWSGSVLSFICGQNQPEEILLDNLSLTQNFLASRPITLAKEMSFILLTYDELNTYICKNSNHTPPLLPIFPDQALPLCVTPDTKNIESLFQLFGPTILSTLLITSLDPSDELQETLAALLEKSSDDDILCCYAQCAFQYGHSIYNLGAMISIQRLKILFRCSIDKPHIISPWVILASSIPLCQQDDTKEDLIKLLNKAPTKLEDVMGIIMVCRRMMNFDAESILLKSKVFEYFLDKPEQLFDQTATNVSHRPFTQHLFPASIVDWLSTAEDIQQRVQTEFAKIRAELEVLIKNINPLTTDKLIDLTTYTHHHEKKYKFLKIFNEPEEFYPNSDYQLYQLILDECTLQPDFDLLSCLNILCPLSRFDRYPNAVLEHQYAQTRILFEYLHDTETVSAWMLGHINAALAQYLLIAPLCLSFEIVSQPSVLQPIQSIIEAFNPEQLKNTILACLENWTDTRSQHALFFIIRIMTPIQIKQQIESGNLSPWLMLNALGQNRQQIELKLSGWSKKSLSALIKHAKNDPINETNRVQALYFSLAPIFKNCNQSVYKTVFSQYIEGIINPSQQAVVFEYLNQYYLTKQKFFLEAKCQNQITLKEIISEKFPLTEEGFNAIFVDYQRYITYALRLKEFKAYPIYPDTPLKLAHMVLNIHFKLNEFHLLNTLTVLETALNVDKMTILSDFIQSIEFNEIPKKIIFDQFTQKTPDKGTVLHHLVDTNYACILNVLQCIKPEKRIKLLIQTNQHGQTVWEHCLRHGLLNPVCREILGMFSPLNQEKLNRMTLSVSENPSALQNSYEAHGFLRLKRPITEIEIPDSQQILVRKNLRRSLSL